MGGDGDPRVHVEANLLRTGVEVRNRLASTFGLVADLPSRVETGCGLRVPLAMTSPHPASVTCPPCREYASDQHRRFADQLEGLFRMPGVDIDPDDAIKAVARHREIAERFRSSG